MSGADLGEQAQTGDEGGGLRARRKNEKVHAIRDAARRLFTTKGYDATTLREVAQLADVGFGTVSSYSKDKSGLLSMLFVDDLQHMRSPFPATIGTADILDQLADALIEIYEFWAKWPELSRIVIPQMEFPPNNPFATIIRARRDQTKAELGAWLALGQADGHIHPETDLAQAAETLFAIFTSCLREWIGSDPLDLASGRTALRRLLMLPISAIRA